ncbi:AraC family transcriptional regulator [Gorillibacterium timonense]|uniref:AraC family transcriptional regulator n=1 Tax=Gorillibacterium timonense TaxID=1689269 RepID=UPI00071D51F3|nr:AraC family transcriptional regulator [Gorillibacterium timonense]
MRLRSHIYWQRKAAFAMPVDRYESWVIFGVESGQFRYSIGEKRGIAAEGDLVVCPPGVDFAREVVTPLTFHFLLFDLEPGDPPELAPPSGKGTLNDRKRLASDYAYLRQLADSSTPGSRSWEWKTHLVADLLHLYALERILDEQSALPSDDLLMAEAAHYMERHFGEATQLQKLAGQFGLSAVQFTRRFREAFQETPSHYLKKLRLRKACTLLNETDLKLSQIAELCGYENGFYLSRVFTREMGVSPSEFRRLNRL